MSKSPIPPKKGNKPVTPEAPPPSTERVSYKPEGKVLPLWPGKPPGETAPEQEEYTGIVRGYVHGEHLHIVNVWNPSIEVFPAPADKNTGAAVIVCPGGCYSFLSYNMEGTEMAKWLNAIGVSCIVLKYRVPNRPKTPRGALPLKDAQRALSLVRSKAATWGIDPERIGIMGFSAGAHLSATASTAPRRTYKAVDAADKLSFRPNFAILLYPAYLFETDPEKGPELFVNAKTPPAIIVQAADDPYPSESSLVYYNALRKAGVPVELHLYSKGGHGYGLRKTGYPSQTWPKNVAEWLKANGWLKK
ncbi:MAG: alpha/beta hydrolase [Puniceicoccales bacterium]|nr:alpha/beta hydrolase [Puniceicoccales bacterium]